MDGEAEFFKEIGTNINFVPTGFAKIICNMGINRDFVNELREGEVC